MMAGVITPAEFLLTVIAHCGGQGPRARYRPSTLIGRQWLLCGPSAGRLWHTAFLGEGTNDSCRRTSATVTGAVGFVKHGAMALDTTLVSWYSMNSTKIGHCLRYFALQRTLAQPRATHP